MKDESIENILKDATEGPKTIRKLFRPVLKEILENVGGSIYRHHLEVLKLLEDDGKMTITQIGETLGISKPQMSRLIEELTSAGAIEREPDPNDRRKSIISLTDEGQKIVTKAMDTYRQLLKERMMPFSEQDLEELALAVKKIMQIAREVVEHQPEKTET